jgi:hypothetical protein
MNGTAYLRRVSCLVQGSSAEGILSIASGSMGKVQAGISVLAPPLVSLARTNSSGTPPSSCSSARQPHIPMNPLHNMASQHNAHTH